MKRRESNLENRIVPVLLVVLIGILIFQQLTLMSMQAEMSTMSVGTSSGTSSQPTMQDIIDEVIPTGTPEYGQESGLSFDSPESSLTTLTGFDTLSLSGEEQARYNSLISDVHCEYCCGPAPAEGCGCAHATAYRGVAKYLIQNSDYTDQEILDAVADWKSIWYPQDTVDQAIQDKIASGELDSSYINILPKMVGGC